MAWSLVNNTFLANRTTAGTSLTSAAVTNTVEVGNAHLILIALDNSGTGDGDNGEVTSVTDSAGNTYTKLGEFTNGNGSAGAGATASLWYSILTSQLTSGAGTVTANFSSRTAVAMMGWEATLTSPGQITVAGSLQTLANDAADPGSMTVGSLPSREYLWLRVIASESNDITGLTVSAGFTTMNLSRANTGTSNTSMIVRGEYIIATGTTKTSDPTLYSADHASLFIALQEDPLSATGTLAVTLDALTAAGTGTALVQGSAAVTLGGLTTSATGAVPAQGSASITLGALTLAGTGTVPSQGALSTTLGALALSGTAIAPSQGTGITALGALTVVATGAALVQGTGITALGALSVSGAGSVPAVGALAVTLGALATSGAAGVLPNLVGAVPTGLTIRTYDGASGAFIAEWTDVTDCDITFGENGPEQASIGLPKTADDGSLNPALDYRRTMPGMRGVLVEVDARGLDVAAGVGVPDVWLGRATSMPRGSDKPVVSVSCQGPHSWLDRETVPARLPFRGVAGRVFRTLIAEHPNALHLIPGDADDGPAVEVTLAGGSLWEAIGSLEEMTLGRAVFTAVPGAAALVADWRDQLAARDDVADRVVLVEGVNCEWDADCDLDAPLDTIAVAGRSFGDATIDGVVTARAPAGPVLGRLAALTAAVSSPVASTLAGQGGAQVRPDLGAASSLYSQADAALRGQLAPPQVASVTVTDESLWLKLRVNKIVETRFNDPLGIFAHALAEIKQITWGLAPERKCSLGVELWSVLE